MANNIVLVSRRMNDISTFGYGFDGGMKALEFV